MTEQADMFTAFAEEVARRNRERGETWRDAALDRLQSANAAWCDSVVAAIRAMPIAAAFTTDQLWAALGENRPPEPRAMGAAIRQARREGLIWPTGTYQKSERPECHARPVPLWMRR